jgi:hypothetical protein
MYGAFVGKSLSQDVHANFYYDMPLREVQPREIGIYQCFFLDITVPKPSSKSVMQKDDRKSFKARFANLKEAGYLKQPIKTQG